MSIPIIMKKGQAMRFLSYQNINIDSNVEKMWNITLFYTCLTICIRVNTQVRVEMKFESRRSSKENQNSQRIHIIVKVNVGP